MSTLSFCKARDPSNPNRQVWIDLYNEEKQGLIYHAVYKNIFNSQYLDLKRAIKIPKAVPSMCILAVKQKYGKPLHAKSRIFVLGNF